MLPSLYHGNRGRKQGAELEKATTRDVRETPPSVGDHLELRYDSGEVFQVYVTKTYTDGFDVDIYPEHLGGGDGSYTNWTVFYSEFDAGVVSARNLVVIQIDA